MRYVGVLLGISLSAAAWAEVPPPPNLPPVEATAAVDADATLAPEVNITQTEQSTVEEYRQGGRLYLVKVTPHRGPPYYFLDRDGDGFLETSGWWQPETPVPMWRLFSW